MQAGIKYDLVGRLERFTGDVRVMAERIVPEFTAFSAVPVSANFVTADYEDVIDRTHPLDFEFFRVWIFSRGQ
jgi:hypothetical protein